MSDLELTWEAEQHGDWIREQSHFAGQCPLTNRAGESCSKKHHAVEEPCSWVS